MNRIDSCNLELCLQGPLWITINSTVFKDGLGNYMSNKLPGCRLANAWKSRSKHILQWRYRNEVSVHSFIHTIKFWMVQLIWILPCFFSTWIGMYISFDSYKTGEPSEELILASFKILSHIGRYLIGYLGARLLECSATRYSFSLQLPPVFRVWN